MASRPRVLLLWDWSAIPWAPIMRGLVRGLDVAGVDVVALPIEPTWLAPELAADRGEFAAVLVGVHDRIRPHLPAWAESLPDGVPLVALSFDDPYDQLTTLDLLPLFDAVLTPEPCAVGVYEQAFKASGREPRVGVLAPTVCDLWHCPTVGERFEAAPKVYDVLHVGGNHWSPRRQLLPVIAKALQAAGKVFGEAAGQRRWIAGAAVNDELQRARLTIDIPRAEFFSRTNPHAVPCTYTTPRVHIAAAAGVPCLVIGPRADLADVYPEMPSCSAEDAVPTILAMIEDEEGNRRRVAANRARFREAHAPAVRGAELLGLLESLVFACDGRRWKP